MNRRNLLASAALTLVAGCTPNGGTGTTQPSLGVVNPLTGQPLTLADIQLWTSDAAAIIALAQVAGVNNASVTKAQAVLATLSNAETQVSAAQASGLPANQQVLADAATAIGAYQNVKAALAVHPAVLAVAKKSVTK